MFIVQICVLIKKNVERDFPKKSQSLCTVFPISSGIRRNNWDDLKAELAFHQSVLTRPVVNCGKCDGGVL